MNKKKEKTQTQEAKKQKLTPKQEAFVRAYVRNGQNASRAAMEAYPEMKPVVARTMGAENLAKPYILARIEEYRNEVQRLANLEVCDVLNDLQTVIDDPDSKQETRLKAMELKGKIIGAFVDRVDAGVRLAPEIVESAERVIETVAKKLKK